MTAANIIVERATYSLTRRCVLRKFFLTPWLPAVHNAILFLLAAAAALTGVLVHHVVIMPNHIHLVITATEANLSLFKRLFFGEVGCLMKVALAENGFEPPERIFAEGAGHQQRLIGVNAQMVMLHYNDMNTVKAGLVERVEQYPGVSTDLGLMNGGVMVLKRPSFYVDRRRSPETRELVFSAPPEVVAAYGSSREAVYQLRRLRHAKERSLAAARTRPVLGALRVTRTHPWSEPRSPRRFQSGATPSFLVVGDEPLRIRCALETRHFRQRYREARRARLAGDDAVFPYGTYAMRVHHGAPVEPVEATEGCVVNAPGPVSTAALSRDKRRALNAALRDDTWQPDEIQDDLAARLDAAVNDVVDRRDAPAIQLAAGDGERARPKLVVLRDSTRSARRRRAEIQRARGEREGAPVRHDEERLDVEPPFD